MAKIKIIEIPKMQKGGYPHPAVESTGIRMFDPLSGRQFSTATAGLTPEQLKSSLIGVGTETKERRQRVAQRKAAKASVDKGEKFTFPDGTTKSPEEMDWRENAYVSGLALQQRGRINENDEAWYDTLNPVSWIADMAGGLGTAPYEAKQSNSNLPYLMSIGVPLLTGRSIASESINPLGKKFWTNDVGNKEFLNSIFMGAPKLVEKTIDHPLVSTVPYVIKHKAFPQYTEALLMGTADKVGAVAAQLPGTKQVYKKLAERVASQDSGAARDIKQVLSAFKKSSPKKYNGTLGSNKDRNLIRNYIYGDSKGFTSTNLDHKGLERYIDKYGELKKYELQITPDTFDFNKFRVYHDDALRSRGILPSNKVDANGILTRDYKSDLDEYQEMKQFLKENGEVSLPSNDEDYGGYDDIAGHMRFLRYEPKTDDIMMKIQDIWKFTPNEYNAKYGRPRITKNFSNDPFNLKAYLKNYSHKKQAALMERAGKPFVLLGERPLRLPPDRNPDYINPLPHDATEAQKKAFDEHINSLKDSKIQLKLNLDQEEMEAIQEEMKNFDFIESNKSYKQRNKREKGGQKMQKGGQLPPIYTSNPNDPRLRAYQDSLYNYNMGTSWKEVVNSTHNLITKENNINQTFLNRKENHRKKYPDGPKRYIKPISKYTNPAGITIEQYKKPVQPVIYQENPSLKELPFIPAEKIPFSVLPEQSGIQNYIPTMPKEDWQYRVEYEQDGQSTHRMFPSQKMGEDFQKLIPGNRTGSWQKLQDGGVKYVSDPNDPSLKSYNDSTYLHNLGNQLNAIAASKKRLMKINTGTPYYNAVNKASKNSQKGLIDNTEDDKVDPKIKNLMHEYRQKGNRGIFPKDYTPYVPDPDNTALDLVSLRDFRELLGISEPTVAYNMPNWEKPHLQVIHDPSKVSNNPVKKLNPKNVSNPSRNGRRLVMDIVEQNPPLRKLPFMPGEKTPFGSEIENRGIEELGFKAPTPAEQYRVEYTDPETGKPSHRFFLSQSMGETFQRMIPGDRRGYWQKMQDGGQTLLANRTVGNLYRPVGNLNLRPVYPKGYYTKVPIEDPNCTDPDGPGCSYQATREAQKITGLPLESYAPANAGYRDAVAERYGLKNIFDQEGEQKRLANSHRSDWKYPTDNDFKNWKAGDIVVLDSGADINDLLFPYDPPPGFDKKDLTKSTHNGVVVGFTPEGRPVIRHGAAKGKGKGKQWTEVLGVDDRVTDLNHGRYAIKSVWRPKEVDFNSGINSIKPIVETGKERANRKQNTSSNESFYLNITPEERLKSSYPVMAEFSGANQRLSTKNKLVDLFNNKTLDKDLQYKLGLTASELNNLKPVVYGIFGQESNFNDIDNLGRAAKERIVDGLNVGSRGPAQIKFDSLTEKERNVLGITKPEDLDNIENSYKAALLLMKNSKERMNKEVERGTHPGLIDKDENFRASYFYNSPYRARNTAEDWAKGTDPITWWNPNTWTNPMVSRERSKDYGLPNFANKIVSGLASPVDPNYVKNISFNMDAGSYPHKLMQKASDLKTSVDESNHVDLEEIVLRHGVPGKSTYVKKQNGGKIQPLSPYNTDYFNKIVSDYNKFYENYYDSPSNDLKDDGYDAYYHNELAKIPYIGIDQGPMYIRHKKSRNGDVFQMMQNTPFEPDEKPERVIKDEFIKNYIEYSKDASKQQELGRVARYLAGYKDLEKRNPFFPKLKNGGLRKAQFGIVGPNCRGKCWSQNLKDKVGTGGGDTSSVDGAPVTPQELAASGYDIYGKKIAKQRAKDLATTGFQGLTSDIVAMAAGDSARLVAKFPNFQTYRGLVDQKRAAKISGMPVNDQNKILPYADNFLDRMIDNIQMKDGKPVPMTVPEILSQFASPENYTESVKSNYKLKKGGQKTKIIRKLAKK